MAAPMPLWRVLERERAKVVERFTERVRRDDLAPAEAPRSAIVNSLPFFLDELVAALRDVAGEPTPHDEATRARQHGEQREQLGMSLDAVVDEYATLHDILLRTMDEAGAAPTSAELRCLSRSLFIGVREAVREHAQRGEVARGVELSRLRAILSIVPVGVVVTDAEARIIEANEAVAAIWDSTPEEITRVAPIDFASFRGFHADGTPLAAGDWHIARALATGKVFVNEEVEIVTMKDRRKWILNSACPIRDDAGAVVGGVAVVVDVTAQKRAQEISAFMSDAATLLMASNLDEQVTLQRLTELAVPRLADWCLVDVVHPGASRVEEVAVTHRDPLMAAQIRELRRRVPFNLDFDSGIASVVRKRRPVLISHVPTPQPDPAIERAFVPWRAFGIASYMVVPLFVGGDVVATITFARGDPTQAYGEDELRVATDLAWRAGLAITNARNHGATRKAVEARDEVLSIVAHDLKNPLAAIHLNASILARGTRRPEQVVHLAEVVDRAAGRMERLIADLLDLSRLEAGKLTLDRKPHDARFLVREVLETLRPLAEQKHIYLHKERAKGEIAVTCDRDRVQQVLSNLVGNAIKFTPEGGNVTVSIEGEGEGARDGECVFTVADTGEGIAKEQLPHIFDRFWQAPEHSRRGSGLGLAIAKGIVDAHGGRIWAESEVGVGTKIRFTIPR